MARRSLDFNDEYRPDAELPNVLPFPPVQPAMTLWIFISTIPVPLRPLDFGLWIFEIKPGTRSRYITCSVPWLANEIDSMMTSLRVVQLDLEEVLFRHGDPATHFFIVGEGKVKLSRTSPTGHEKVVSVVQSGNSFAEAVMFMEQESYPVTSPGVGEIRLSTVLTVKLTSLFCTKIPLPPFDWSVI